MKVVEITFSITLGGEVTDTLLSEFMTDRFASYDEPSRRGTYKGNPIGFSKEKYTSSLLSMTTMRQKEIAKMLEISFGTVRNWHTQSDYFEMVDKHAHDFANELIQHVAKKISETLERYKKDGGEPILYNFPELKDRKLYGDIIKEILWMKFFDLVKSESRFSEKSILTLSIAKFTLGKSFPLLEKEMLKVLLKNSKDIIEKSGLEKTDKDEVLDSLKIVEQFLE